MKIVCDACQAKYSISDDKVQGKVFKIRCKKCSNIIVVRGGASEQPQVAAQEQKDTRVYDYGYEGGGGDQAPAADDAVWHLVVNQDQVGPMTVAEVQQRFAAGEIDGETFTWREGFGDWLPLSQVEPFTALVASGSTTSASNGGGGAAAIGAMFGSGDDAGGTSRNDPGDLFASASASSRSSADEDDGGGDLFGAKPSAGSSTSAAASAKLRGERNENSVLFSLNNLAQLASDKPAMSAPGGGGGGGGHATGAAGGEGSGLIDIRSMASAYMGGGGAGAMGKPQTASAIGSIDDLPVFGGGGFSEPAVLVPTVRASANNKVLYMMIAAVSLLAVVAIIMVVIMMKGRSDNKTAATTGSNAVAIADTGSAAAKPDVAGSDTTTTGGAAKPAVDTATGSASGSDLTAKPDTTTTAKADPTPVKTTTATVAKKDPKPSTPSTHQQVASTKADKKAEPAPTPTPKADTGGCDEVSCVLNNYEGACCSKFRKGGAAKTGGSGATKPAASGGADLPDGLDRGMISSGIANVKARVSACGDKSPAKGKVKVHVKVGGDGKVAGVNLESSPDAGLGACVVAAVLKASFSKTQSGGSFSYPFVF